MVKPMIVVVEDDRDLGDAILDIIEMAMDVDVELIGDGLKAQQRFEIISPQLILLDMHLPKVSGIELLEQNLNRWRASGAIVVVMTADLMLIPQVEALVNGCLPKPFSVEKFVETVSRLLDRASEAAASAAESPAQPESRATSMETSDVSGPPADLPEPSAAPPETRPSEPKPQ